MEGEKCGLGYRVHERFDRPVIAKHLKGLRFWSSRLCGLTWDHSLASVDFYFNIICQISVFFTKVYCFLGATESNNLKLS